MAEVAQEAPSKEVSSVTIEAEVPSTQEKNVVAEAVANTRAKRASRPIDIPPPEHYPGVDTTESNNKSEVVKVSDAENLVAIKMENEFLRVTSQITQLQKQAETIQKNFPEYIKGLAQKYAVDLTVNDFHLLEGVFKKKQVTQQGV